MLAASPPSADQYDWKAFKQPTPAIPVGSFVPVVGNWAVSDFVILLFCFKLTVVFSFFPGFLRHPVKEHHLCLVSRTVHYGTFTLTLWSFISCLHFRVPCVSSSLNRPYRQWVPSAYFGLPGRTYWPTWYIPFGQCEISSKVYDLLHPATPPTSASVESLAPQTSDIIVCLCHTLRASCFHFQLLLRWGRVEWQFPFTLFNLQPLIYASDKVKIAFVVNLLPC